MKTIFIPFFFSLALVIKCSDGNIPSEPENFDNLLQIQTDKNQYFIAPTSSSRNVVINGILTNIPIKLYIQILVMG